MKRLFLEYPRLTLLALCASFAISAWGWYADNVINNDGVAYIAAARHMIDGDWRGAMQLFKWPFYPLLVASGAALTHLDPETVARMVNGAFYALIVVAFMAVVVELGGKRRTVYVAALVVLLLPSLNDTRTFIIRDPGYIALYLMAFLYLLRYWESPSLGRACTSMLYFTGAILFRVEGVMFLIGAPLLLLPQTASRAAKRWAVIGVSLLAATTLVAVYGWWAFEPTSALSYASVFEAPGAVLSDGWAHVATNLVDRIVLVKTKLLTSYTANYAYVVLILTALLVVVVECIGKLTLIHAGIVSYSLYRKWLFPGPSGLRLWWLLIMLNIVMLSGYVFLQWVVAQRYLLPLVLTVLVASPFGLEKLWERWRERRAARRFSWGFPVLVLVLAVIGLRGLDLGTHKGYLREAGVWLSAHTSPDARIYTNDKVLAHYSEREARVGVHRNTLKHVMTQAFGAWWRSDYIALRLGREQRAYYTDLVLGLQHEPVKTFENSKGDSVLIFKTR